MRRLRPLASARRSLPSHGSTSSTGIDGTISAGVRGLHLRRSRYIGLAKTHLQHMLTAAAMSLIRIGA
jgi:IS5 family transposase